MILERMSVSDVPWVLQIEHASFTSPNARRDEAQLAEELARPWARLWVVRANAAAPAAAFLVTWHVADELQILDVATNPELRRHGYARALMDQALAYAREHAVRQIVLEARRSNVGAIALYRACGFHVLGVRPRYYPDDEDAVDMMLVLDDAGALIVRDDEVSI